MHDFTALVGEVTERLDGSVYAETKPYCFFEVDLEEDREEGGGCDADFGEDGHLVNVGYDDLRRENKIRTWLDEGCASWPSQITAAVMVG